MPGRWIPKTETQDFDYLVGVEGDYVRDLFTISDDGTFTLKLEAHYEETSENSQSTIFRADHFIEEVSANIINGESGGTFYDYKELNRMGKPGFSSVQTITKIEGSAPFGPSSSGPIIELALEGTLPLDAQLPLACTGTTPYPYTDPIASH